MPAAEAYSSLLLPVILPGAAEISSSYIVCMESMITTSGTTLRIVSSTVSSPVSQNNSRLSENSPRRLALILICRKDSSPDMYSTFLPSPARFLHTCSNSVDLPIPGSPPTNVKEPGTIPPPSTLSSSSICVSIRLSSCMLTSDNLAGAEDIFLCTPWLFPRDEEGIFSSTIVFHSLHPGHCPIHLEDS